MDSPDHPPDPQPSAESFDPIPVAANIARNYLDSPFSHPESGPYDPAEAPTSDPYNKPHEVALLAQRDQQIANLEARHQEDQGEKQKLMAEAIKDPLTGLLNRRGAEMAYERISQISHAGVQAERRTDGPPRSYAFILDLDGFKAQNDTHGHDAGDQLLREIAKICNNNVRQSDFVARWGGDEFVILAPGMSVERADDVASAVRQEVQDLTPITTSIGVCEIDFNNNLEATVKMADEALLQAKAKSKNVVVHFNPAA